MLGAITKWVLATGIVCSSSAIASDLAFAGGKDIVIGIATLLHGSTVWRRGVEGIGGRARS